MTKAERKLLFTLARKVQELQARLDELEAASDLEAEALIRSLSGPAPSRAVETVSDVEQPDGDQTSYTATDAARAYLNKKSGAAAKPNGQAGTGELRWANGQKVSREDQGLGAE